MGKVQRNLHQGSFVFHGADHSGRSSFLRRSHEARVCEPRLEVEPEHHEAHQDDPDGGRGGDDGTDVDQPGVVHAHHATKVQSWGRPKSKVEPQWLVSPNGEAIIVGQHDCAVETGGEEEGEAELGEDAIVQLQDGADGPEDDQGGGEHDTLPHARTCYSWSA